MCSKRSMRSVNALGDLAPNMLARGFFENETEFLKHPS